MSKKRLKSRVNLPCQLSWDALLLHGSHNIFFVSILKVTNLRWIYRLYSANSLAYKKWKYPLPSLVHFKIIFLFCCKYRKYFIFCYIVKKKKNKLIILHQFCYNIFLIKYKIKPHIKKLKNLQVSIIFLFFFIKYSFFVWFFIII